MPSDDKAAIQRALNRLRYTASRAETIQDLIKDGDTTQALIRIETLIADIAYSEGLAIEAECALDRLTASQSQPESISASRKPL